MGNEKMQSGSGAGGDTHESVITAARARMLQVHGVEYLHLHTEDGGELYVTRWGRPYLAQLRPESWYERTWFRAHRERLKGTSTVYRVRTRPSAQTGRSIHIVVKWNRMGQDVPLETRVLEDMINAEFNSPFEEFALVEEMRRGQYGPPDQRILSHRPLAVYVPPDRLQLWQTGRSREKINRITRKHPGVEIDILRQYIMIYEWIKGVDAVQAFEELDWPAPKLWALTGRVTRELSEKGYRVADMKPAHIIVRWKDEGGLLERHGELSYALVDFELLQRTPEHQEQAVQLKRKEYLQRQRERFEEKEQEPLPEYLHRVTIMGVDYIYGHVESTGGALWVVGKDPKLFDYFQPERWRKTQQVKLSQTHPVFLYPHQGQHHAGVEGFARGRGARGRPRPGDRPARKDPTGLQQPLRGVCPRVGAGAPGRARHSIARHLHDRALHRAGRLYERPAALPESPGADYPPG